ncbi:hypothetical protein PIB30_002216 [Stylosanthes scabra]|uniref:Uncharacterized protein n=1 Tax=Stylosanthes scabra TaxID=79078 RepID=A0ABU6T3G0_9FABA|nr:hypothetical protein [Stylosanthes scabra]
MKLYQTFLRRPSLSTTVPSISTSNGTTTRVSVFRCNQPHHHQPLRFIPTCASTTSSTGPSPRVASNPCFDVNNNEFQQQQEQHEDLEARIEKVIYRCRFLASLGVFGSLIGSFLCFIKGSTVVVESFSSYLVDRTKIIQMLIEALDVYLLGTVMLDNTLSKPSKGVTERPKWLDISTVNELKTKVGHVIVMLLLIGLFDKSKRAVIQTPLDLLCFCASLFLSSSCLFLLSKLNEAK